MTIKARRSLFYSLILVFILLGSGAVLYAQGWRIDLAQLRIGKVGGIYLRVFPSDGSIYVDDKLERNTPSILDGGVFIDNLFPSQHDVRITRDGYESWTMKLTVYPARVTKMEHVLLTPKPSLAANLTTTTDIWVAGETVILRSASGLSNLGGRKIPGQELISLSQDGEKLLTKDSSDNYFLAGLKDGSLTNVNDVLSIDPSASNSLFAKNDSKTFFYSDGRSLYITDFDAGLTSVIATAPQGTSLRLLAASNTYVVWSIFNRKGEMSHIFWEERLSGNLRSALDPLRGEINLAKMGTESSLLLLTSVGEVYTASLTSGVTEKIASDGVNMAVSLSGKHVAILEHKSLEVFLGSDEPGYIRFNIPSPEEISSLEWSADEYNLFLHRSTQVQVFDIQDGGVNNLAKVAETNKSAYSSETRKLYYVEKGALYLLQFAN